MAPAGWYLDPSDATRQRYWDGLAWTAHTVAATWSTNRYGAQIAPVEVKGMSFLEAVKSVLTNYVGFSGRARRSEYWWFSLFYEIVALVVMFAAISIGLITGAAAPGATSEARAMAIGGTMMIAVGIAYLILLTMFLPNLAVTVRRLHDTNRSGWYYLISLIPFAGILLLVFMVEDSTMGPNRYGPSPKYV
jgi:uncharacterized membrane protein YhaH (DUF805 family)